MLKSSLFRFSNVLTSISLTGFGKWMKVASNLLYFFTSSLLQPSLGGLVEQCEDQGGRRFSERDSPLL